jgi:DNA-binding transcriptional MerR regulator
MGKWFSKGQVAELLEITPRTVSHYTEEGVIIPVDGPGETRKNRKYSENNLFEIMLVLKLRQNGFDLSTIKDIMPMLRGGKKMIGPGNELLVIYDGHTEHGSAVFTSTNKDKRYNVKMKGHSSAVIIDIIDIRNKWMEIVK